MTLQTKGTNMPYISISALQSIPPSCLNRDDMNLPKTCVYGQVDRMRISSQCYKAAMRKYFAEHFDGSELSVRTKYLIQQLEKEIKALNPSITDEDAGILARKCVKVLGLEAKAVKEGEEEVDKLGALLFVSKAQIRNLASIMCSDDAMNVEEKSAEWKELKKNLTQAIKSNNSVDLALFGRMVASSPNLGVDGSMDVAHTIGVSELVRQDDFYSAVDDCNPRDDSGAAMIGDIRFVSDVAYRFASININSLRDNLSDNDEVLRKAVKEAVRAFICTEPTAKQTSMATHVMPEYVRIELRDAPMSYVSAFETPVECVDGLMEHAI